MAFVADRQAAEVERLGSQLEAMLARKQAQILSTEDLVDLIWKDRPGLSEAKAVLLEERYSGRATAQKLEELRAVMRQEGAEALLISTMIWRGCSICAAMMCCTIRLFWRMAA